MLGSGFDVVLSIEYLHIGPLKGRGTIPYHTGDKCVFHFSSCEGRKRHLHKLNSFDQSVVKACLT